ncbi:enoyl-CoA hydratase-related protein [Enterovirga aerilata]|uniref:Enoyl-CoA hydratase n=1 Tax=Enterovirga aerilata TaxID=2730920 RepID=A0A849I3C5_9HYPH|nr:enoyl-CoA hydratase-related protein [Enterovirga sp. DB1703]NNM71868.1 enoyl-CoA hydratase [Enterovirga sp. DB1703]
MTEHVALTREDGGVLLVRLARPEKKNALTGAMYEAMTVALAEADADEGIGAVVLAGSGGVFTAGNDLGDFLAVAQGAVGDLPASRFIRQLARTETPLVAAVEGLAIGVGTTLTFHCDLVYAAPDALFRMPFVDLGLVPEAGSSHLLPRRIGLAKATELLMLGEAYDAAEALRLGLVNAVVPTDRILPHALMQAARIAAKPRAAVAATRRLIRGDGAELARAMENELRAFREALVSPEARQAFEAFLAKAGTARR